MAELRQDGYVRDWRLAARILLCVGAALHGHAVGSKDGFLGFIAMLLLVASAMVLGMCSEKLASALEREDAFHVEQERQE